MELPNVYSILKSFNNANSIKSLFETKDKFFEYKTIPFVHNNKEQDATVLCHRNQLMIRLQVYPFGSDFSCHDITTDDYEFLSSLEQTLGMEKSLSFHSKRYDLRFYDRSKVEHTCPILIEFTHQLYHSDLGDIIGCHPLWFHNLLDTLSYESYLERKQANRYPLLWL